MKNVIYPSVYEKEAEQQKAIIFSLASKRLVVISPLLLQRKSEANLQVPTPSLRHITFNGDVVAVRLRSGHERKGDRVCRAIGIVTDCVSNGPYVSVRLFGSHYDLHHRRYVWYPTTPETSRMVYWDDLLATVGSLEQFPPSRYTPHDSWAPRASFARSIQRALEADGWIDAQGFLEKYPALALAGVSLL